jgi:hypothetical protein
MTQELTSSVEVSCAAGYAGSDGGEKVRFACLAAKDIDGD